MNIHEYQGKELLKRYGVTVLDGHVAWTPEEAEAAAAKLPGPVYVVKSQIHAGGRGAGRFADDPNGKGGVRLARSPDEVRSRRRGDDRPHADHQADRPGTAARCTASMSRPAATSPANCICRCWSIGSAAASPSSPPPKAAWRSRRSRANHPEKILRVGVDPASGISGFHARRLASGLGPDRQAGVGASANSSPASTRRSSRWTARSSRSTRWS